MTKPEYIWDETWHLLRRNGEVVVTLEDTESGGIWKALVASPQGPVWSVYLGGYERAKVVSETMTRLLWGDPPK